jgi:hypothetical protein
MDPRQQRSVPSGPSAPCPLGAHPTLSRLELLWGTTNGARRPNMLHIVAADLADYKYQTAQRSVVLDL